MYKLGVIEQSLVICLDWCLIWIRTLLRFSLDFIVKIVCWLPRLVITYERTLPKRNPVVAHLDLNELLRSNTK